MKTPEKRNVTGVIDLLSKLHCGSIRPDEVTTEERRTCVSYLRLEGYTQEEMAKIFDVHRTTIGRDEKIMAERAAKMIKDLKPQAMVAGLIAWAKHLTSKTLKEKDYGLAWKIQKELVDKLESLGLMGRRSESGLAVFLGEQGKTVYVTHWGNEDPDERPALPAPKNDESEDNN